MELHEVINSYIEKYGYESYLEIGVRECYTFDRVACDYKEGIDPYEHHENDTVLQVDSDSYFSSITKMNFDVILIDGLHLSEQVVRDINNSLSILKPYGVILVHDVLPWNEEHQQRKPTGGAWAGDVWKGFLQAVLSRNDVNYLTIPETSSGVGVVYFQDCPIREKLNWKIYEQSHKALLRVK